MKPIQILCLHGVRTGGPEAIHQLSDALLEQGFDARLIYYTWPEIAALEQAEPQDGYIFAERSNPFEEYAHYKANVSDRVENREGTIVVLPETLCHLAPKFNKATVLIWWLSVDNGFGALSRVNLNHLRKPNVKHAAQSQYAYRFLDTMQFDMARRCLLSDYTTDLAQYAPPLPWAERGNLVLFNANHKVIVDLQEIFDEIARTDPTISCQAMQPMSRTEVATLFAMARLYVDLGSLPGKDRLPREALQMGCQSLIAMYGAGTTDEQGDFAMFQVYPFDKAMVAERVRELVHGNPQFFAFNERHQFRAEVREIFSAL